MQETKVLYSANEGRDGVRRINLLRWVDVLTLVGVVLAIGVVLGGAVASGDPTALFFVKMSMIVMSATIGIFVFLLLLNWVGWWALLMFVPGVMGLGLWVMGVSANELVTYWAQGMSRGMGQVMEYGLWGFAGLAGLSGLARLLNKVGTLPFMLTLVVAMGVSMWWLR